MSDEENAAGATTEQSAARNCGAFLLELTKELPKEMTSTITSLQSYLESDEVSFCSPILTCVLYHLINSEKRSITPVNLLISYLRLQSYTLRISVLGMMCEALNVELKGEGLSDEQRIMRDDFLDDMYEHMHDTSAYVRHKVSNKQNKLKK